MGLCSALEVPVDSAHVQGTDQGARQGWRQGWEGHSLWRDPWPQLEAGETSKDPPL